MKKQIRNISAITAALLTLSIASSSFGADKMNKAPANLLGKVYPTVSENLIADFNSESFSWLKISESALISREKKPENDADGYVLMDCEPGGSCSIAKNFRALMLPAIAEFKIKCMGSGEFYADIYTRGSFPVRILAIRDGEIYCGGEKIATIACNEFVKLSVKFEASGDYSLYIDEKIAKEAIKPFTLKKLNSVSAIEFGFSSSDKTSLALDDVYVYEGAELMDEFTLLGNIDKAIYRTSDAIAFVDGYTSVYSNRRKSESPFEAKIIGGNFFIPLCYTLNSLGFEASYSDGSVTVHDGKTSFIFTKDKVASPSYLTPVLLSANALDLSSELLVCASDIEKIFNLSRYYDGEDLLILSKSASVYEHGDDVQMLSSLLKTQITNLTYALDSLGRRVKIASSLDYYDAKPIEIKSVTGEYVPQPENPPANVTDGDFSTRYAYDNNEKTLDIDLGEVKEISAYAISWYNGSIRKNEYILHYSEDGVNWSSLPRSRSTGQSDKYEFITCPIKARYIKYQGFGTYTNADSAYGEWNSVTEIAFFEEEAK